MGDVSGLLPVLSFSGHSLCHAATSPLRLAAALGIGRSVGLDEKEEEIPIVIRSLRESRRPAAVSAGVRRGSRDGVVARQEEEYLRRLGKGANTVQAATKGFFLSFYAPIVTFQGLGWRS